MKYIVITGKWRPTYYCCGQCAYCPQVAVLRQLLTGKWTCEMCIVRDPDYHRFSRYEKLRITEEYNKATHQLTERGLIPVAVADVPIERMLTPSDRAWLEGLTP